MYFAAAGFIDGLVSGFKYVHNALKATVGLAQSIAKGFTDVAFSIIAVPFRSLEALIAISNKLVPLMEAIARASEEVRKQFGDIATGTGRQLIETARELGTGLEHAGLTGYQVFGSLDEAIQSVNKTASAMGATFELFQDEIRAGGGSLLFLQKGLGFTDEVMQSTARRALAMGTTMATQMKLVTKFAVDFGKRFGVSQKLISRDIGTMIGDVKSFGNLAPKELAKVSVYARKLGIDVKDLLGVVEKFDTFESAAESAAMLSQAFGANADAIKLMKAENPADRIEELRRAFLATGKSADMLTRQELKLLSQTTGLSEETARAAFSQKNMGLSMQELEKQGKITEARQLTTAEAIAEVSASIERIIKPFKQFTGFLQALADGFARGLFGARDFRDLLTKLHNALRATYKLGMDIGKMFVDIFPGFSDLTRSFREFIDSGRSMSSFSAMIGRVRQAFKAFFTEISDGPEAVGKLFTRLKASFSDFLASFSAGQATQAGETFAAAMGNIVAGIIQEVSKGAVKIIKIITDLIQGKGLPTDIPGGGIAKSFLDPIITELKDPNGAVSKIGPAFIEMLKVFWKEHGDKIKETLTPIATGIAVVVFGSAFIKAAIAGLLAGLTQALMTGFASWIAGGGLASLTTTLTAIGSSIVAIITSPFVLIPAAIAAALGAAAGVSVGMEKFRENLDKEFGTTEAMVGASVAGIIDVLTLGLVPDSVLEAIGKFTARATEWLLNAIRSLPFGETLVKNIEGLVQSAIEYIQSVGDVLRAVFEGDTDKLIQSSMKLGEKLATFMWRVLVDFIPTVVTGLTSLFVTGLAKLGELIAWVLGQAVPWIVRAVSTLLAVVAGVVTGIVKKIGENFEPGGLMRSIFDWLAGAGETVTRFFTELADDIKKHMGLWNVISSLSTKEFYDGLKGWAAELATDFWKWIKDVFSSSKAISAIGEFTSNIIDSLKSGLSSIGNVVSDAAGGTLKAFKDVWGIRSPSTEAAAIGLSISQGLSNSLSSMPDAFKGIATTGLDTISEIFEGSNVARTVKDFTSPAVTVIKSMIEEANVIGDTLKNLDPINLDAKLQALADRLGVDGKEFKVKQGQVNIMINLDVSMEAETLAKVLAEHGIVSTERPIR
jgi:hypothetical protein